MQRIMYPQQPILNYVVAFDLSDDAVNTAANYLKTQLEFVAVVDVNQLEKWQEATQDCTLYLIEHGNGQGMGEYKNPKDMLKENQNVNNVYKKASTVVLVSCSTANEADLILKQGGFQARTFAENFKKIDETKKIKAAVGPVIPSPDGLKVQKPTNAIGASSVDGWVTL